MSTVFAAAQSSSEQAVLQTAWSIIYYYLDANRTKVFAKIGWKFIQFTVDGSKLLEILTPLFGGPPSTAPEPVPNEGPVG